MIRRPPSSPLFPSTPLFGSLAGVDRKPRSILQGGQGTEAPAGQPANPGGTAPGAPGGLLDRLRQGAPGGTSGRSEEHTSELQSPCNLVCRLLLEKKKKSPIILLTCINGHKRHVPLFFCLRRRCN